MAKGLGKNQQEAWGAILLAHALLTRKIDRLLLAEGLPSLQVYDVLLALEDAPNQRLRMGDLAETVVFDPSSITRIVERLERQGLVTRESDSVDRRRVYACITEKGLEIRNQSWPRYRAILQEHFGSQISDAEASAVAKTLLGMFPDHPRLKSINVEPSRASKG